MAKKKTSQSIPVMSPEKYIRNNSRNLPVVMCKVNKDWQEGKIANILIVREHKNGNITACVYLVDLMCLGVKDTMFIFNETRDCLEKIIEDMNEVSQTTDIPYNLAHNIIFEAIEFAGTYGFQPHKDFTKTTSFFLEENNENIPLMDIECGNEGKPHYINTGDESLIQQKQILAQLEKMTGEEPLTTLLDDDDDCGDDDELIETHINELENMRERLLVLSYEEKKDMFKSLGGDLKDLSFGDYTKGMLLADMLTDEIVDDEVHDSFYDELFDLLYIEDVVDLENLPNSFCEGIPDDKKELIDLYFAFDEATDKKKGMKLIKKIREQAGDVPLTNLCDLCSLIEEERKYLKHLKELRKKFPDYPMFKLLEQNFLFQKTLSEEQRREHLNDLKKLFSNRDKVTFLEYDQWIFNYMYLSIDHNKPDLGADLGLISACSNIITELNISEHIRHTLSLFLLTSKQIALTKFFSQE